MKRIPFHFLWTAALSLLVNQTAFCGKDISSRFTLGAVVGNWQPHNLNDEPRFSGFGAAGATPFYGFNLLLPIGGEIGLQFSAAYWSLHDLKKVESVHTLTLHPVSLDFKYWLVPDSRLSTFVLYGGSVVFGIENETSPFGKKIRQARTGWGVNLGAGFDLALSAKIGLGALFQYHFVRFKQPLGGVDDFSGPKIAGEMLFFL
jgi:hypothetical protein